MNGLTDQEQMLAEQLEGMIKKLHRSNIIVDGVCQNIDPVNFVCDVVVGDSNSSTTYTQVPLKVLIGSQASFIEIPKDQSECIICFRDGNSGRPQMLFIDQVDKLLINCNEVIFNNGNNGGLIDIVDMVSAFNALQDDVNTLKNAFNTWVVVPEDGGAALKAAAASWSGQQLKVSQQSDFEDKTVTH